MMLFYPKKKLKWWYTSWYLVVIHSGDDILSGKCITIVKKIVMIFWVMKKWSESITFWWNGLLRFMSLNYA